MIGPPALVVIPVRKISATPAAYASEGPSYTGMAMGAAEAVGAGALVFGGMWWLRRKRRTPALAGHGHPHGPDGHSHGDPDATLPL